MAAGAPDWFSSSVAPALSETMVFPAIRTDDPAGAATSPPKWMVLLFCDCGPFSITLFSMLAMPPFGRSML